MSEIVLQGCWPFADRCHEPYLYLPFEIPAGIEGLEVSYETSLRSGRGVEHVDIGLFDTRGHDLGSSGFRGWSGSARNHFTVTSTTATPGYIPGPIDPGHWSIILGTESRTEEDVSYTVQITLHADASSETVRETVSLFSGLTAARGARYYRGDLHCHTVDSDGMHALPVVVSRAVERGLDFLAITNHNVLVDRAPLPAGLLDRFVLLGGEEVTTYRGHLNVWGIHEWIDFRVYDDTGMRRIVDEAGKRGAVTSINHPKTGGPDWEYEHLADIQCMEVWGAPWVVNNCESLALYDRLLTQGRRITAVGGSDIHVISMPDAPYMYELGNPTTHVYTHALSERAILDGLVTGRVSITAEPGLPPLELRVESDGTEVVMGQALPDTSRDWTLTVDTKNTKDTNGTNGTNGYVGQRLAVFADGTLQREVPIVDSHTTISMSPPAAYVRVEVWREPCTDLEDRFVLALSNPVYRG